LFRHRSNLSQAPGAGQCVDGTPQGPASVDPAHRFFT
jgi:hypothetical protein